MAVAGRWVLDEFYNNPKFEQIVYRPFDADGKKLLMLPTSVAPAYSNESFVSLLEANGGRHDVRVISMWAISAQYWTGVWDFFQFCQAPCGETSVRAPGDVNHSSAPKMCSTTSMVDVPDCNQNPSAGPGGGKPATFEITGKVVILLSICLLPISLTLKVSLFQQMAAT